MLVELQFLRFHLGIDIVVKTHPFLYFKLMKSCWLRYKTKILLNSSVEVVIQDSLF
jgi:hypothetical protein